MKQIDEYANSICKNMDNKSGEVKVLKHKKKEKRFKSILYISSICSLILVMDLLYSIINYDMLHGGVMVIFIPIYITFKYKQLDNYRKKGININKFYESMKVFFTAYILVLISSYMFPMNTYPYFDLNLLLTISLKPLNTILNELNRANYSGIPLIYILIKYVKMILLFIPFGFFVPIFLKKIKELLQCIIAGVITFLLISLLQVKLYSIGIYAGSLVVSVDYMILNMIGVLIGFLLYNKNKKFINAKLKKFN
ncbi:VanZ family protein [Clostridium sp.]|uniref:VanZ family protein n=1 Tax=Clostridium sp. TaxID=1506 RepID=UPI003463999B